MEQNSVTFIAVLLCLFAFGSCQDDKSNNQTAEVEEEGKTIKYIKIVLNFANCI